MKKELEIEQTYDWDEDFESLEENSFYDELNEIVLNEEPIVFYEKVMSYGSYEIKNKKDYEKMIEAVWSFSFAYGYERVQELILSLNLKWNFFIWMWEEGCKVERRMRHLYLIGFEDNSIKIGISMHPEKRVKDVANSSGRVISKTKFYEFEDSKSALKIEGGFKKKFKDKRINGEFFNMDYDDVVKYIEERLN